MPGGLRSAYGRGFTKNIQFADLIAIHETLKENPKSGRKKPYYQRRFNSNSSQSIAKRTNTSIDKFISSHRQAWNSNKSNLSKLDKISNNATEKVCGVNPLNVEFQPLPIKKTYRYRQIINEDPDYQDTGSEASPSLIKDVNRSHTVMNTNPAKFKTLTMYKNSHETSLDGDTFGETDYPSLLSSYYKRREVDKDRILKLAQPRVLPEIKKQKRKRKIRMKINKSLSLSNDLPPNNDAKVILFNTAKASKTY